uniref:Uncharacterized protein n=1 Tax=Tetraselmis sp. GSL018 TaxID=582737 RepID=A0A061RFJ0_9CHLO
MAGLKLIHIGSRGWHPGEEERGYSAGGAAPSVHPVPARLRGCPVAREAEPRRVSKKRKVGGVELGDPSLELAVVVQPQPPEALRPVVGRVPSVPSEPPLPGLPVARPARRAEEALGVDDGGQVERIDEARVPGVDLLSLEDPVVVQLALVVICKPAEARLQREVVVNPGREREAAGHGIGPTLQGRDGVRKRQVVGPHVEAELLPEAVPVVGLHELVQVAGQEPHKWVP